VSHGGKHTAKAARWTAPTLRKHASLTIRIGLNLQPGQRLAIGPLANSGVSLDGAQLVRCLTDTAYRAGASYVEAIWGD
jgi:leucyl aminopeptidase (aminopeptidase T)